MERFAQRIAYGLDESQFGDLRLPAGTGPHPTLIVIHGGFWKAHYGLDLMDAMCADLTARGYATWNIEYRRVGQVGGGYPGTLQDVASAAEYVRTLAQQFPLDLGRVVVTGHSAGGHLALWLAGRRNIPADHLLAAQVPLPLAGVVSLAGVCDLQAIFAVPDRSERVHSFLDGTPDEVPSRYAVASPAQLLPLGVPQVLLHGLADSAVPPAISQDYAVLARAAGDAVELVELPGADHFAVIQPGSAVWPAVIAALASPWT